MPNSNTRVQKHRARKRRGERVLTVVVSGRVSDAFEDATNKDLDKNSDLAAEVSQYLELQADEITERAVQRVAPAHSNLCQTCPFLLEKEDRNDVDDQSKKRRAN